MSARLRWGRVMLFRTAGVPPAHDRKRDTRGPHEHEKTRATGVARAQRWRDSKWSVASFRPLDAEQRDRDTRPPRAGSKVMGRL